MSSLFLINKQAEFTPEDLYTRKRPIEFKVDTVLLILAYLSHATFLLILGLEQDRSGVSAEVLPSEKLRKLCVNGSKVEDNDETISDTDMDSIIGIADSSQLEVIMRV